MIGLIVYIIIFVLIIWLLHKIIKSVVLLVVLGLIILLISIGVFGYFVVQDAIDLREHFADDPKLFLLKDDAEFLSGIRVIKFWDEEKDEDEEESDIKSLLENVYSETELSQVSEYYVEDDLESIKGINYKVFIVDIETFEKLPDFDFFEKDKDDDKPVLDKALALELLRSDQPLETFLEEAYDNIGKSRPSQSRIDEDLGSPEEFKATLFFFMTVATIKKGPVFIIKEMKEQNIIIYPETIIFKTMRKTPIGLISKGFGAIKEKINRDED